MISLILGKMAAGIATKAVAGIPLRFLVPIIVFLIVCFGAGYIGYKLRDASALADQNEFLQNVIDDKTAIAEQAERDKNAAIAAALDAVKKQNEADEKVAEDHVRIVTEVKTVYKVIEREAEKVIVNNCDDLGPDWMRVFNRAVTEAR